MPRTAAWPRVVLSMKVILGEDGREEEARGNADVQIHDCGEGVREARVRWG